MTTNRPVWKHTTFAQMLRKSPKKAFEYRYRALGTEIPAEYQDKEVGSEVIDPVLNDNKIDDTIIMEDEKTSENDEENTEVEADSEETETEEVKELERSDLEKILEEGWVKFQSNWKDETLLKKAIKNNLI